MGKKKNLLVSFSGGETSGRMVDYLINNKSEEYNMLFAFANTSKEREETLIFADKLDKYYDLNLVWIEATFAMKKFGTNYRIVDFESAKREGEVFEEMIKDYGIPNLNFKHCTRELKTNPLRKLATDIFNGEEFYIAIGYRNDEIDRMNSDWILNKHYYPLIIDIPTSKPQVNLFWRNMPFRLGLKGYEGNCNKCWKKSDRKLMTIEYDERENGCKRDDWWSRMEYKYGDYTPPHRIDDRAPLENKLTFYRGNKSSDDIYKLSLKPFKLASDDSIVFDYQMELFGDLDVPGGGCSESCEPFS